MSSGRNNSKIAKQYKPYNSNWRGRTSQSFKTNRHKRSNTAKFSNYSYRNNDFSHISFNESNLITSTNYNAGPRPEQLTSQSFERSYRDDFNTRKKVYSQRNFLRDGHYNSESTWYRRNSFQDENFDIPRRKKCVHRPCHSSQNIKALEKLDFSVDSEVTVNDADKYKSHNSTYITKSNLIYPVVRTPKEQSIVVNKKITKPELLVHNNTNKDASYSKKVSGTFKCNEMEMYHSQLANNVMSFEMTDTCSQTVEHETGSFEVNDEPTFKKSVTSVCSSDSLTQNKSKIAGRNHNTSVGPLQNNPVNTNICYNDRMLPVASNFENPTSPSASLPCGQLTSDFQNPLEESNIEDELISGFISQNSPISLTPAAKPLSEPYQANLYSSQKPSASNNSQEASNTSELSEDQNVKVIPAQIQNETFSLTLGQKKSVNHNCTGPERTDGTSVGNVQNLEVDKVLNCSSSLCKPFITPDEVKKEPSECINETITDSSIYLSQSLSTANQSHQQSTANKDPVIKTEDDDFILPSQDTNSCSLVPSLQVLRNLSISSSKKTFFSSDLNTSSQDYHTSSDANIEFMNHFQNLSATPALTYGKSNHLTSTQYSQKVIKLPVPQVSPLFAQVDSLDSIRFFSQDVSSTFSNCADEFEDLKPVLNPSSIFYQPKEYAESISNHYLTKVETETADKDKNDSENQHLVQSISVECQKACKKRSDELMNQSDKSSSCNSLLQAVNKNTERNKLNVDIGQISDMDTRISNTDASRGQINDKETNAKNVSNNISESFSEILMPHEEDSLLLRNSRAILTSYENNTSKGLTLHGPSHIRELNFEDTGKFNGKYTSTYLDPSAAHSILNNQEAKISDSGVVMLGKEKCENQDANTDANYENRVKTILKEIKLLLLRKKCHIENNVPLTLSVNINENFKSKCVNDSYSFTLKNKSKSHEPHHISLSLELASEAKNKCKKHENIIKHNANNNDAMSSVENNLMSKHQKKKLPMMERNSIRKEVKSQSEHIPMIFGDNWWDHFLSNSNELPDFREETTTSSSLIKLKSKNSKKKKQQTDLEVVDITENCKQDFVPTYKKLNTKDKKKVTLNFSPVIYINEIRDRKRIKSGKKKKDFSEGSDCDSHKKKRVKTTEDISSSLGYNIRMVHKGSTEEKSKLKELPKNKYESSNGKYSSFHTRESRETETPKSSKKKNISESSDCNSWKKKKAKSVVDDTCSLGCYIATVNDKPSKGNGKVKKTSKTKKYESSDDKNVLLTRDSKEVKAANILDLTQETCKNKAGKTKKIKSSKKKHVSESSNHDNHKKKKVKSIADITSSLECNAEAVNKTENNNEVAKCITKKKSKSGIDKNIPTQTSGNRKLDKINIQSRSSTNSDVIQDSQKKKKKCQQLERDTQRENVVTVYTSNENLNPFVALGKKKKKKSAAFAKKLRKRKF